MGTKKERKKYDYLNKKGTVQTRHDYIETSYVNGVKDANGETVIRPMTSDEKEWLSQFIAETEHGNLNKSREIKDELKVRRSLKGELVTARRKCDVEKMLELEKKIATSTEKIEGLRAVCNNFYTKEEDAQWIYEMDNARRRDVYNNAKISDNLVLYDLNEYDKFTTEAVNDVDPENVIIDHLHYVPVRKKGRK
jgi:hypothetical protein